MASTGGAAVSRRVILSTTQGADAGVVAEWTAAWPGLELSVLPAQDPDTIDGNGAVALVSGSLPRDLSRWSDLRWVQLTSAGADQLAGSPVAGSEIAVTTASGTHGVPIAEYVTAGWLMMLHGLPESLEFHETRSWPDRGRIAPSTARGRTVGIVGYGAIGRECARQLQALGMRIVCAKSDPSVKADPHFNAWSGTGDPDGSIPDAWYGPDRIGDLIAESDLIVVTVPSTPRTLGMIGAAEFARAKPGARLIVVSRGGIVDEAALAAALRDGQLREALVDCFVQEPPAADDPLFETPHLLMTPHVSGLHDGYVDAFMRLLGENLRRFDAGEPLLNQVDTTQWRTQ
jgi:phosphoglycerate dehydrogenase-like enzyme